MRYLDDLDPALLVMIELDAPRFHEHVPVIPQLVVALEQLVDALKAAGRPDMKVIVGGAALESVPDLYKTMGAEKHLRTFDDICALP